MTALLWAGDAGFVLMSIYALLKLRDIPLFFVCGMLALVRIGLDSGFYTLTDARIINSFTPWVLFIALVERAIQWRRA